jgi:predicted dehydrogenase
MKNIQWGILGAGKIAAKFASAINFVEGADLYAVASRDLDKAKAFASEHQTPVVYANYASLAADPNVDIIYIATPHAFHCEQALLCLEAKKPVLCEKPMALNEKQVKQMIKAASTNHTFLMEGMWSRFMPAINKVQELISNDVIGKVQYVRADFGFAAPYDVNGRLYNLKLGGGSLLDVGIYPLFLTVLLFGEPASIQSVGRLAATGADEYCNMIFQYPGGETASIFSSITTRTSLTAEIAGRKGRIYMHNPWYRTNAITLEITDGETTAFTFPHEHNGFEYEIRHVMQCLQSGLKESPLLPFEFSLILSRTMDKIRKQVGVAYEAD